MVEAQESRDRGEELYINWGECLSECWGDS